MLSFASGIYIAPWALPTAPSGLNATGVGSSQINIAWTGASVPPPDTITRYYIYRNGSLLTSVNPLTFAYSDFNVQPSTTYTYTVAAVGGHGQIGPLSNVASAGTSGTSTGPNFPRVAIVASGGDQSYGQAGTSGFTSYTASGPGTTAYTAVQQLGSFDMVCSLAGSYEGWQASNRNKQNLVQAIKGQGTFPNIKNNSRTPYVFLYSIMESSQNATSGLPYQTFVNLIRANNWWTYETPNGSGTILPSGNSGFFEVNYSYAWPGSVGSFVADTSICGHVYGTLSNGQGPAQTAATYFASALLTTNAQDSRFFGLTNGAAPNADGLFLDNVLAFPNGGGNLGNATASWDGQNTQNNATLAVYPSGASSLISRGQFQFFQTMQSYLATCNPGSTYLNFGNAGNYANTIGYGNLHSITGSALDNTLHGMFVENVSGVAGSGWQNFMTFADILTNYNYGLAYCLSPKLVALGNRFPATDGSSTTTFTTGGTATTVAHGTALEYQSARCMLALTLLNNGYFAVGVSGYNYGVTPYYDEFGDDSLTQVNVKRGYLGQPLSGVPTSALIAQGPLGIWGRQFTNGIALINPWGNGTQTLTAGTLGGVWYFLNGTQAPSVNSGALFQSFTFADGDGLILLNQPGSTQPLTITTTSPLPGATTGSAYGKTLNASGGVPPYTWSLVSAAPDSGSWVQVTAQGVLEGTPSTAETESIVIKVTDSVSTSTQSTFSLTVTASNTTNPTPQSASGTLAGGSTLTVNGTGFGATGPNVILYDDFERATPGQQISLTGLPIGAWSGYNNGSANYLASNVAAHTGSVSMNVIDTALVTNGVGTQAASNTFNLSIGNQQEMLISFWCFTPNQQFVGEFGNNGVSGTAPAPGTYPTDSCWKQTWVQPAKNTITGPWDLCTPTYTGGTWQIQGASGGFDVNLGEAFFSFSTWNRHTTWLRGAPNATGSMSSGFFQALSSEKGMTTFQFGTAAANPLFHSGGTEFSWVNFPGYAAVANKSQAPLYDDVYIAVCPPGQTTGAVACVEIGDASTYTNCKHMTRAICSYTNWTNSQIICTIPATGLDFSAPNGQRYIYVWNANGTVNSTGLPI